MSLGIIGIIGGGKVNARATLERREESLGHAASQPRRHVRQTAAFTVLHSKDYLIDLGGGSEVRI